MGSANAHLAAPLKTPPSDLATLSAQNGGKFPELHVTSAIKGDRRFRTPRTV
jgi:hypothetical protein